MKVEETKIESTIQIAHAKLTSGDTSQCRKQGASQGTQEISITNLHYSSNHQLFKAQHRNAQQANQRPDEIEWALLTWEDDGGRCDRDDERHHNG